MPNPLLNEDIYARLLSFVCSPAELLALGLANKQLHTLSKHELIYCSIRCMLGDHAVWEHLIAYPLYASRVRHLEIQRENDSGWEPLDEKQRFPQQAPESKQLFRSSLPDWNRFSCL